MTGLGPEGEALADELDSAIGSNDTYVGTTGMTGSLGMADWDTILLPPEMLNSPPEILGIIAKHEVGHWKSARTNGTVLDPLTYTGLCLGTCPDGTRRAFLTDPCEACNHAASLQESANELAERTHCDSGASDKVKAEACKLLAKVNAGIEQLWGLCESAPTSLAAACNPADASPDQLGCQDDDHSEEAEDGKTKDCCASNDGGGEGEGGTDTGNDDGDGPSTDGEQTDDQTTGDPNTGGTGDTEEDPCDCGDEGSGDGGDGSGSGGDGQ